MTTPSATGGTAGPTAAAAAAAAPKGVAQGSNLGPDAFMKLLVAQMKYQDPMSPTDGQQFMSQMATFTQVEKLGQLVSAQAEVTQWQRRISAEGMVGREITGTPPAAADGTPGVPRTGVVTGVTYAVDGPVLSLSTGGTLALSEVTRVAPAPAAATPATPAPTPPASTPPASTPPASTPPASTPPASTPPASTTSGSTSAP